MSSFGIYVHIPFCKKKCKYCDFVSFDKYSSCVHDKYVDCVIKEIENCKCSKKVDTIYFGGGTPSLISYENINKILRKICEKFDVDDDCEITIEVNPGTVDYEKLSNYKKIGINRLSIGLQSTNDRILKLIGRIHKYNDFVDAYEMARNVGFDNINVDLMLGIPTQTLDEIKCSVEKIVKINPEHVSFYSLILEEGTELEKLVESGILELPDENLEREMYWTAKEMLENSGYNHYEISNFAKKGMESKHNLNCWNQCEYRGFGVSAHSYVEKERFSNIENLEKYIENVINGYFEKNRVLQEEKQNYLDEAKEFMMLGLRKIDGVCVDDFAKKFDKSPLELFEKELSELEKEELIEKIYSGKIKLSKKGLDLANLAFERFI